MICDRIFDKLAADKRRQLVRPTLSTALETGLAGLKLPSLRDKATGIQVGLLVNFTRNKAEIKRMV
jgi:hypothetical protein